MEYEPIQVEFYSGYKAIVRPLVFEYQGQRWEVSEIVDRWHEGGIKPDDPIIDYFKVKTTDNKIFIVRYTAYSDGWSILNQR